MIYRDDYDEKELGLPDEAADELLEGKEEDEEDGLELEEKEWE